MQAALCIAAICATQYESAREWKAEYIAVLRKPLSLTFCAPSVWGLRLCIDAANRFLAEVVWRNNLSLRRMNNNTRRAER